MTGQASRARAVARGALLSAAILVPCLLPTFAVVYWGDHGEAKARAEDVKVVVRRDAVEKDFPRFSPRKVFHVGLHVEDVSKIDVAGRSFSGRFVFWARNFFDNAANDRSLVDPSEFRIVNRADLETEVRAVRPVVDPSAAGAPAQDKAGEPAAADGERLVAHVSYEASGELRSEFDLRRYPFDRQVIQVVVEPRSHTSESMILGVDPASALSHDVDFGEWELVSFEATSLQRVAQSDYSDPALIDRGRLWNSVPRVVFSVTLKRMLLAHLLKELLPLLVIMLMAYGNFFIGPTQIDTRASVAITGLLAVTALHWTSRADLPGVSYLMAADQFYLIAYALMLIVTLDAIVCLRVSPPDGQELPEGHARHPWLRFGGPALRVLFPLVLAVGWLAVALRASS